MKVKSLKDRVMTLQEAFGFLDQVEPDNVYVTLKEIEPGKYIVPMSVLDIHANRYGKIDNQYGQKVKPAGGMQLAHINPPVAAGGLGSLEIPLGAYLGMDARNTDYEFLIHYVTVMHDDTGNNRQLSMRYVNATMACELVPLATITISPDLMSPVYPHLRDSGGAYHPTYPGGWGSVVVDGVNNLILEMPDLANGFLMRIRVVYSTQVFD